MRPSWKFAEALYSGPRSMVKNHCLIAYRLASLLFLEYLFITTHTGLKLQSHWLGGCDMKVVVVMELA